MKYKIRTGTNKLELDLKNKNQRKHKRHHSLLLEYFRFKGWFVFGSMCLAGAWVIENTSIAYYDEFEVLFLRRVDYSKTQEQAHGQADLLESIATFFPLTFAENPQLRHLDSAIQRNRKLRSSYQTTHTLITYGASLRDLDRKNSQHPEKTLRQLNHLNHLLSADDLDSLIIFQNTIIQEMGDNYAAASAGWNQYYKNRRTRDIWQDLARTLLIVGGVLIFVNSYHEFLRHKKQETRGTNLSFESSRALLKMFRRLSQLSRKV